MEYKSMQRKDLNEKSTEELKEELEDLKNELLFMTRRLDDKNVSYEQKSEFLNSDIPNAKENMEIIEEILSTRKSK